MQNPVNPKTLQPRRLGPADTAFIKDSGGRIAVPVVTLWALFADISQSLQVSSASIKAATSSLLDGTIIWNQSTQYEFVQSIDKTIDHVSSVSVAMTLAMKLAGDNLTFILEPNSILEILSRVADALRRDSLDFVNYAGFADGRESGACRLRLPADCPKNTSGGADQFERHTDRTAACSRHGRLALADRCRGRFHRPGRQLDGLAGCHGAANDTGRGRSGGSDVEGLHC